MPRAGEIFRQERENQGLTLRDIEEVTSIRLKYLEAIENGNNDLLPGEVYAKGFVRNYAITLGLDGDEFVGLYKLELEKAQNPEPVQEEKIEPFEQTEEKPEIPAPIPIDDFIQEPVEPIQIKKTVSEKRQTPQPKVKLAPILLFLCVFIVAVLVGVYIILTFFYDAPTETPQNQTNQQINETATKPEATNTNITTTMTSTENKPEEPLFRLINDMKGTITIVPSRDAQIRQIEVEAVFKSNCWTRVIADGEQIFSGMLGRGSSQKWQAKENIKIRVGNVDAVDMTVNGEKLERIADGGPVVDADISILK